MMIAAYGRKASGLTKLLKKSLAKLKSVPQRLKPDCKRFTFGMAEAASLRMAATAKASA
jgi:hypothetical protein